MMLEVMDCDLHRVIQSKQPLTDKHYKCFMKQIVEGVKAMHSIGVFHRDLKPGNILVSKDCQVRITDFGLARFVDEPTRLGKNEANPMTAYVVTRWYRCPELLLAPNMPYNEGVDMWSVGCILGELLRRAPLFPGKNDTTQLKYIFDTMGYDGPESMGFPMSKDMEEFFDKHYRNRKKPLYSLVPEASGEAYELLEALLTVNPKYRPSAVEALEFKFFDNTEVSFDYTKQYLVRPPVSYFDFENEKHSIAELKKLIDLEVFSSSASAYRHPKREIRKIPSAEIREILHNQALQQARLLGQSFPTTTANTASEEIKQEEQDNVEKEYATYTKTNEQSRVAQPVFPSETDQHKFQSKSYDSSDSDVSSNNSNGPESQMPTQVRHTKAHQAIKRYSVDHEVGKQNGLFVEALDIQREQHHIDETRKQLAQLLLRETTKKDNDPNTIQASNILATVRNDVGPPGTRGRSAKPKTPTASKMDVILKKDSLNKQRFQEAQQVQEDNTNLESEKDEFQDNNIQFHTSGNRRSTFPHPSVLNNVSADNANNTSLFSKKGRRISYDASNNPFATSHTATDTNGVLASASMDVGDLPSHQSTLNKSSKKFGSFIGVPFPSLAKMPHSVSKAVNKRINNLFHGSHLASTSGSNDEGDHIGISASQSSSFLMQKSSNILHSSGSNVILPNSTM